ncbi:Oidioi.mRNA.OKI2018_I69.PAR.g10276.t1.cds [Oikopleura dioica]|uniref:Oidioi.mRNA.OKI2018_I69.PAR.g10276.t1.cds n=1 Tax=Oikopleura dioica TaxID=34765 RepID=A0ABN7RQV5_OIKDI|nr:Oidioi.mRNA.OKI2018_I69.PAR.g10276.t1.cds [Oikopleura dioica]
MKILIFLIASSFALEGRYYPIAKRLLSQKYIDKLEKLRKYKMPKDFSLTDDEKEKIKARVRQTRTRIQHLFEKYREERHSPQPLTLSHSLMKPSSETHQKLFEHAIG